VRIIEIVRFILLFFCFFLGNLSFSQSYRFANKNNIRNKILQRTASVAVNYCFKNLEDFNQFIIVDTTFEIVLVKQTVADSIQKIDYAKEIIKSKIESNIRLIDRIKLNLFWYPLKKQVYEKEIEELDEEVLKLVYEIEKLSTIKLQLLETPNMEEVDYYKVTYIGDSKNKKDETMFWYTTIYYEPDGQVKIVNFEP
jgi:hypothetical protein